MNNESVQKYHYTEEERAELLSNPYTFYVSDCRIVFTLAFKQFVIREIDKPEMNAAKVFQKAGYRLELFPGYRRRYVVQQIRKEAASEKGLQKPKPIRKRSQPKKNPPNTLAYIKDLEQRIQILEQQIDFLKKSRHLEETGALLSDNTD